MHQNQRVSVIILGYKNYEYVYEAIDSVLIQDYPNIELIVSNDASNDFDVAAVISYIEKNNRGNICDYIVNQNKTNLGTIRHLNHVISKANGEFLLVFAADDALFNENVISQFITEFENVDKEVMFITSQVAMYGMTLDYIMSFHLDENQKNILRNKVAQELFPIIAKSCFIGSGGTCYRKEIFSRYGSFNESYQLIEDWSLFLKLTRENVSYHYLDIISLKHRDGGISHGNVKKNFESQRKYKQDEISIIENEILPYFDLIPEETQKYILNLYHYKASPLISVCILGYKNYEYVFEAIDSVLMQNYGNIEIIVSNDGSLDFQEEEVINYIHAKSSYHIDNVIVNQNAENMGTVKHINSVIEKAHGEFILFFAADDALYSTVVISNFIESFKLLAEDNYVVTSQVAMYGSKLDHISSHHIDEVRREKILKMNPIELFEEIAVACFIGSGGTCYKKSLFEKFGYFDEKYFLIEDWPFYLKLLREGVKIHYFDQISLKHRSGGISHGNANKNYSTLRRYKTDEVNIYKNEIIPFMQNFSDENKKYILNMYHYKESPIVTVCILGYKNYQYIYEAIDSVLSQNYGNIELIVSNDGSRDFNQQEVLEYINAKSGYHIVNVIVNQNETNMGTVKHLNYILKQAMGEYILFFAADDALYSTVVISDFVEAYKKIDSDVCIVTSQVAMYGMTLDVIREYHVSEQRINQLQQLTPKELFGEIVFSCFVGSGGTCYRKDAFERYGYFDEKYFLIEDWGYFLRLARNGAVIKYLDRISLKHRDGGISHGNVNNDKNAFFNYRSDELKTIENEIIPFMELLNKDQQKKITRIYKMQKYKFINTYLMENKSRIDKIKLAYEYKSIILSQGSNYIFKRLFVPFKDWCGSLYDNRFHILKMGIIMIMAYQFIDWSDLFESYQEYIHLGLGYVGILAILFAPLLSLARKIYRTIKWVVRKTRRK